MAKKNIAVICGGYSGEYVISMQSVETALKNINRRLFNPYKIVISKDSWSFTTEDGKQYEIDRNDFSLKIGRKKITFDAVLNIIHGTPGEDGKLQGYFEMLGIPQNACDSITSALTFNKRYTLATAAFAGINVAKSLHLFKHEPVEPEAILKELSLPLFVKPNNGGSSLGISKVNKADELEIALEKAFNEDEQVLVEEFIKGEEFTVGVFKNAHKEIKVLPVTQIVTKKEFFDFEAKYTPGLSEEIVPAPISKAKTKQLQDAAQKIYQIFNCKGVVRIDFIWNDSQNQPYMLEINTTPGQTENSILPRMLRAAKIKLSDFYTDQIKACLSV